MCCSRVRRCCSNCISVSLDYVTEAVSFVDVPEDMMRDVHIGAMFRFQCMRGVFGHWTGLTAVA